MIRPLKQVYNDFIAFLKSPKEESIPERSAASKLKYIGILYLIELPVIVIFIMIMSIIQRYKLIDLGGHIGDELFFEYSYATILFVGVIIAPLLEEIIFRLPLRYRRNYLFRLVVWCISITGLVDKDKLKHGVQKFWKGSFPWLFYTMAITFGLIHLTNFSNAKSLILLAPILTITQIFGGLIMGYIRVKIGFIWGFTYHAAHNFIFLTIAIVSIASSSFNAYHYKDTQATIDIIRNESSGNTIDNIKSYKVTPMEIKYQGHTAHEIIASLTNSKDKYIIKNGILFKYNYNISSTFTDYQDRTDSARSILLGHLQKAFGLKIERKMINKEAWELYVTDSSKFQIDTINNGLFDVNGSLKYLGNCLDRQFQEDYIFSMDTVHYTQINVPARVRFEKLPEYLEKEYGLGLRKVYKEIEFINIELAETKGSNPMI